MSTNNFWDFPYLSTRLPIMADNVVCTSQPLAAQAGLRALQAGGNAVDAALATAITLTVVEPVMNGIGGDAFVLVWDKGRLYGLNASGRAPAAWTPERFQGMDSMPSIGWDTVTVPGQVAGWADLSQRFGRLPFAALFESAIHYAEEGFPVSPTIARQWAEFAEILKDQPGFAAAFMPGGKPLAVSERWRFPAQARTLKRIAETAGRDFYEGELAEQIAAFAKKTGGALTQADLAAHVNEWVEPISINYRDGYTVHELPPNGQGIATLMALGMLDRLDPPKGIHDAIGLYHLPLEALKLAFADLYRYVGEPADCAALTQELLHPDYLASRARLIDPHRAQSPVSGIPGMGGTVYVTTADADGMVVSFIQSNYKGFGSGVVVPDTGIALHNRGRDFSLEPGHNNQVGPGKRSLHTIIPGFLTRDGKPLASFGVMGGNMQAQGHLQVVQHMVDLNQNAQAAIDAPRFRIQPESTISLEQHASPDVVQALIDLGHPVFVEPRDSLGFGASQIIQINPNGGYIGATDPRRDGSAVGF